MSRVRVSRMHAAGAALEEGCKVKSKIAYVPKDYKVLLALQSGNTEYVDDAGVPRSCPGLNGLGIAQYALFFYFCLDKSSQPFGQGHESWFDYTLHVKDLTIQ